MNSALINLDIVSHAKKLNVLYFSDYKTQFPPLNLEGGCVL